MCQSLKNPCKALEVNRFLRCFNVFSSKHLDIQRFWFILNKFIPEYLNNPWIKVGKYLLLLFNIQEPLWMQIIKRLDKLKTDLFQMVGFFFTFLVVFFSHFCLQKMEFEWYSRLTVCSGEMQNNYSMAAETTICTQGEEGPRETARALGTAGNFC